MTITTDKRAALADALLTIVETTVRDGGHNRRFLASLLAEASNSQPCAVCAAPTDNVVDYPNDDETGTQTEHVCPDCVPSGTVGA